MVQVAKGERTMIRPWHKYDLKMSFELRWSVLWRHSNPRFYGCLRNKPQETTSQNKTFGTRSHLRVKPSALLNHEVSVCLPRQSSSQTFPFRFNKISNFCSAYLLINARMWRFLHYKLFLTETLLKVSKIKPLKQIKLSAKGETKYGKWHTEKMVLLRQQN